MKGSRGARKHPWTSIISAMESSFCGQPPRLVYLICMQHAPSSTPLSLVWISGATEGIGLGLARNVPYANARVINLSRRQHPDYESHLLDLAEPASWDAVGAHFAEQLSGFTGERAIFIQNAHLKGLTGFVTEVSGAEYQRDITANVAAPLRLGEMFLRAVRESGFAGEAGLVMMSSSAARSPVVGQTVYCAGKAALEMWVRVTRRELALRAPHNIWVTAVRPGFVDTALTRHVAAMAEDDYPLAPQMRKQMAQGVGVMDIDTAGRQIWAALPTDQSLLLFGEQVKRED